MRVMSEMSLSHASNIRVIKAVAKMGTSYYPEIMKKVWIVNVPWAFAAAWNLVAPMLPEQTRKKVAILGSYGDYKDSKSKAMAAAGSSVVAG